jgi:hypothetical protein
MIPITWFTWIAYDEAFCESARLSKEFNSKIELLLKSGVKNIKLSDVTDFEWDVVCVYGEEIESLGEVIDLKDNKLINQIGYKPKFLFRSTYYIPYDFGGFAFSNSSNKKIHIMHRVWRKDYKTIFIDLYPLVMTKIRNKDFKYLKTSYLGPNECFKLNKNFK